MTDEEIKALQDKLAAAEKEKQDLASKVDALTESVDKLTNKNRDIIGDAKKAKEAAEALAMQTAKKDGDIESLERSWQEKLEKVQSEKQAEIDAMWSTVKDKTVGSTATKLASELAIDGSAEALLPHIKPYLAVEMQDGKVVERILDAEGKPSAMTLDDLKSKIQENKALAPLIKASSASGGGQAGGKGSGGKNVMKDEDFEKLSPSQKLEFVNKGGELI